jgi:ComF family protein
MLLDLLLPRCCLACGVLLRFAACPELCSRCAAATAPLPDALRTVDGTAARYAYDGPLAEALVRFKYGAEAALAGPLGRALTTDPRWRADADGRPWDLVTAVPMHRWRRLHRGFDHAALMLRHAHREVPVGRSRPALLVRTRNDPPQATLPAAQRARNLVGAFAIARGVCSLVGLRILVVDDVTTTGATLREAVAVLRDAGASAAGLALLRTLPG